MLIKKNTLDDKFILELAKIFKKQNWNIESSSEGEKSMFDMFCKRLEELENDSDREFMLELTCKYLVVDFEQYSTYITEIFRKLVTKEKEQIKNIDTIHIFPIQDKDFPNKTKSGNVMCYLIQGIIMRRFEEFHDKRIRIIETYDGIKNNKNEISLLLLVDDFIGSGDTALGCINLLEEIGVSKDKIRMLSLVAQETGKKVIEDYGVSIINSITRNKAISDNYQKEEVEQKLEQMKRISKSIKVRDKNLFLGYKDSEGLVSMIKTPNNTFPFYWYECMKNGRGLSTKVCKLFITSPF